MPVLKVDTVNEKTSATGVTVDSLKIKDTYTTEFWKYVFATEKGTDLAVTVGTHRVYVRHPVTAGWTLTIEGVVASVGTAPTGAAILIDVHKNGTTIWTTQGNRPSIAISGNGGALDTDMDVTSLSLGDYFTVDIDQVGSSTKGKDLVVEVWVKAVRS
ncbi:MAG: hypothetical protein V3W51_04750 [Candidatus Brocadiales bacterium]